MDACAKCNTDFGRRANGPAGNAAPGPYRRDIDRREPFPFYFSISLASVPFRFEPPLDWPALIFTGTATLQGAYASFLVSLFLIS